MAFVISEDQKPKTEDQTKDTLFAGFKITPEELDENREILKTTKSVDRIYNVELKDRNGKVYCLIEKTLYIANK